MDRNEPPPDDLLVIRKLAETQLSNPAVVEIVKNKQKSNPKYEFLQPGGKHHKFYLDLVSQLKGNPTTSTRGAPQKQPDQERAYSYDDFTCPEASWEILDIVLKARSSAAANKTKVEFDLNYIKNKVQITIKDCSQANMKETSKLVYELFDASGSSIAFIYLLTSYAKSATSNNERLHCLYIINDVVFRATREDNFSELGSIIGCVSPLLIEILRSKSDPDPVITKTQVDKVLNLWRDKSVFDPRQLAKVRADLVIGNIDTLNLPSIHLSGSDPSANAENLNRSESTTPSATPTAHAISTEGSLKGHNILQNNSSKPQVSNRDLDSTLPQKQNANHQQHNIGSKLPEKTESGNHIVNLSNQANASPAFSASSNPLPPNLPPPPQSINSPNLPHQAQILNPPNPFLNQPVHPQPQHHPHHPHPFMPLPLPFPQHLPPQLPSQINASSQPPHLPLIPVNRPSLPPGFTSFIHSSTENIASNQTPPNFPASMDATFKPPFPPQPFNTQLPHPPSISNLPNLPNLPDLPNLPQTAHPPITHHSGFQPQFQHHLPHLPQPPTHSDGQSDCSPLQAQENSNHSYQAYLGFPAPSTMNFGTQYPNSIFETQPHLQHQPHAQPQLQPFKKYFELPAGLMVKVITSNKHNKYAAVPTSKVEDPQLIIQINSENRNDSDTDSWLLQGMARFYRGTTKIFGDDSVSNLVLADNLNRKNGVFPNKNDSSAAIDQPKSIDSFLGSKNSNTGPTNDTQAKDYTDLDSDIDIDYAGWETGFAKFLKKALKTSISGSSATRKSRKRQYSSNSSYSYSGSDSDSDSDSDSVTSSLKRTYSDASESDADRFSKRRNSISSGENSDKSYSHGFSSLTSHSLDSRRPDEDDDRSATSKLYHKSESESKSRSRGSSTSQQKTLNSAATLKKSAAIPYDYGMFQNSRNTNGSNGTSKDSISSGNSMDKEINTSNVGYKMLEKMGWQKGKGLGSTFEGITQPIDAGNAKIPTKLGSSHTHHKNLPLGHGTGSSSSAYHNGKPTQTDAMYGKPQNQPHGKTHRETDTEDRDDLYNKYRSELSKGYGKTYRTSHNPK